MSEPLKDSIPDLLVRNIPRAIVMGVEDALTVGSQRAYAAAYGMDDGHLPHVPWSLAVHRPQRFEAMES
jgi:hypothetical protein